MSTHIDTHEPPEIKRLMVELLGMSPAPAETYYCQIRDGWNHALTRHLELILLLAGTAEAMSSRAWLRPD